MTLWHHRPMARIGLRLIGLALLLSLKPQGAALQALVDRSDAITPAQGLLAAACFVSASLGAMLLCWGHDLWQPVQIARRWHGHAMDEDNSRGSGEKIVPDGR